MVGCAVVLGIAVLPAPGGHVGLHADDGLDVGSPTGLVESDGTVHSAVVSEGQGRHPEVDSSFCQLSAAAEPVQEGIFAVDVEMDEVTHRDWIIPY